MGQDGGHSVPAAIGRIVLVWLPLVVGIVVGTLCWNYTELPFHNPYRVNSVLARAQYNPQSNLLRVLCFLAWPMILLLALRVSRIPVFTKALFARPSPLPQALPWSRAKTLGSVALVFVALVSSFYAMHPDLGSPSGHLPRG